MQKRFLSVWFPYLMTNWLVIRRPALRDAAFVFTASERGRIQVKAVSAAARSQGISSGIPLADAKALVPGLEVFQERPGRDIKLLRTLGEWCIRYTPLVAPDLRDGLMLDISGCAHLWGGEEAYLNELVSRLKTQGYEAKAAIADTIGASWAIARFGRGTPIIECGKQAEALLPLPPSALRVETGILDRMQKLGLYQISDFINMPGPVLRRRFGKELLMRLGQATGMEEEALQSLQITVPYQQRLPCLEPIKTASGIEIALQRLLEPLCKRLQEEEKGLRLATLTCYRIDGKIIKTRIGTNSPSHHIRHLFKLFALHIPYIEPALGIELFVLEANETEDHPPVQEALWSSCPGMDDQRLTELLDRLAAKVGAQRIHRYLPEEHFWPERSVKPAHTLLEQTLVSWHISRPRPTQLLPSPQPIQVSAPIPDYPPMLFIYQGKQHHIKKADGPERIAREWWLEQGEHRDYYYVEDEEGQRYWLFRSGHYAEKSQNWFIHGFFA